ncbi:MAG: ATP-binding cassette domain-containing protein [Christensenellaceae bacterium]|jgi:ABC-type lipoprotein export system ATPase subunit/ABC-type antimicrobial peptide transport system permease subunit|nr:ATP-binding cassette domain-containing protein [Christensenellaceae bacterium]
MIVLKKIVKIYKSQSGVNIRALDGVDLSMPSKGMIFVTGKSGCGKSTLLNLIGGLDETTSGEILFCGKAFCGFNQADFDNYRNNAVGFVFQDFNLIDRLSVKENIGLALLLQRADKTNIDKAVCRALDIVGLSEYKNRRISELSGGQKQRIAIARAIVKDSKIILADEPTGNLDSETSREIFELLEKISQDKLVIVVSHDKENANIYGDRIIELKDGQVINDKVVGETIKEVDQPKYSPIKTKLPFTFALQSGVENLLHKKWRSILSSFTTVLAIFVAMLSIVNATYSVTKTAASTIVKNNIDFVSIISDGYIDIGHGFVMYLNQSVYKDIKTERYLYGVAGGGHLANYLIRSKQDLIDFGFEFHNALEIDDESVYVTDFMIEMFFAENAFRIEYGSNYQKLDRSIHDYNYIVGKKIDEDIFFHDYSYYDNQYDFPLKIAGIIKTDYRNFYDENMKAYTDIPTQYYNEEVFRSNAYYFREYFYQSAFFTENYYKTYNLYLTNFSRSEDLYQNEIINISGNAKTVQINHLHAGPYYNLNEYEDIMLYGKGGSFSPNEIQLKNNEIIISVDLHNKIFDNQIKVSDYVNHMGDILKPLPPLPNDILNVNIDFEILGNATADVFSVNGLKIVGILMRNDYSGIPSYDIYSNDETKLSFVSEQKIAKYNLTTLIRTKESEKENVKLLNMIVKKHGLGFDFAYAWHIYDMGNAEQLFVILFIVFSIVMVAVSLLLIINLITSSILSQKKEIGILRALGASIEHLKKTYLLESGLLGLIVFVFSSIAVILGITGININIVKTLPTVVFFTIDFWYFALAFAMIFSLYLIATLIPLGKLNKMNPIDVIKN